MTKEMMGILRLLHQNGNLNRLVVDEVTCRTLSPSHLVLILNPTGALYIGEYLRIYILNGFI